MKRSIVTMALGLIHLSIFSQQKLLTIDDALINNRTTLAPQNLKQLQFIKGTNDYAYLKNLNGSDTWVRGNFTSDYEEEFLSLNLLNGRLRLAGLDTLPSLPPIQFNKENWVISLKGQKYSFNTADNQYKVLIDKNVSSKQNIDVSVDGNIAYVDNYNLYVTKNGSTVQVTKDGSKDIVYASSVHRDEFGISKGTFWSNDGKQLAFYRMDQQMVTDYPIIDWSQRPAKNENIKYPMAGDKSHQVKLGIYNANIQNVIWVNTGLPAEQYLTNIAWSPDDKFVFIAIVNREQNHMWLNQYNAESGVFIKTLFEEKDEKYVEPLTPMLFLKNDAQQFLWQSNRDGWNHLYLYNIDGSLVKQLTAGTWEVIDVKGFDESGQNLFYTSTKESPVSRNLYMLNIPTANSERITKGNFMHSTLVSADGNFVIDNHSSLTNPRTIQLTETLTGKTKILLQSPDPLQGFTLGELSIFTIKNNSGDSLYCRMYTPAEFDTSGKYPVIVYWYGGSHAQLIGNSWNGNSSDYWFQYMAQRGYIVFTIDTRGSDNRGKAFEQAMFRNVGDVQMQDMMTGVNYLRRLPYVDTENMGLFGWSFGGFNTIDFMLNFPDVFKAAVAGGPVTDWKLYEIMYTERYMDTPQENPLGYASTDLSKKVDKLKGKLLLIHGLQDNVVVQQHSVNFVKAAIEKGIQVDYMIYPGHEHNVLGKERAHLYKKITDYFIQNLEE